VSRQLTQRSSPQFKKSSSPKPPLRKWSVVPTSLDQSHSHSQVKKKKRAPKVGYAREEGDEEDAPPNSAVVTSIPSVDSAEPTPAPASEPPPSVLVTDSTPPRLPEPIPSAILSQQEVTIATPSTSTGEVPSYILRKEEMMRKANGANASLNVPPPSPQPEVQRRDSIDASKTAAVAPEPEHKADGSVAFSLLTSSSAEPQQSVQAPLPPPPRVAASCPSLISVAGRKIPLLPNQVTLLPRWHLPPHLSQRRQLRRPKLQFNNQPLLGPSLIPLLPLWFKLSPQ
jgi:hypothetical protein